MTWSCCNPCLLLGLLLLTGCASTLPVPKNVGAALRDGQPVPTSSEHKFSEDPWAQVLQNHVEADGSIHFDTLKKDPSLLRAAARQVALARPEEFTTPEQELAFAINAYNTLAMRLAVESDLKPRQKIRFFVLRKQHYLGKTVSLWTLENRIIRPMGDPRIHFALNCMVKDCPRLLRVPYKAEILDEQLHAATLEFVGDPRRVRYEPESDTLHLSRIFKWYRKDFETEESGLIAYINGYTDPDIPESATVKWLPYDWGLNQTPPKQEEPQ